MSRDAEKARADVLAELAGELRRCYGLGASFLRAAAARGGMTDTDLQVIDHLESTGPMTAGQLADLTGLTTGAITGMLNRLEEAGVISRERDPDDGRRVIVRLAQGNDQVRAIGAQFASLGKGWQDIASGYDDEQIATFLAFLKRGNERSRQEIERLRESQAGVEGNFTAPLEGLASGRLVFPAGILHLTLHTDDAMTGLYQARFERAVPDVKVKDGVVTIRYPRRLLGLSGKQGTADVALSTAIPWWIEIQGGAAKIAAALGDLKLVGLEIKGGLSTVHIELPAPEGVVPIRMSGGAAEVVIHRPAHVAARAHLKGWFTPFAFDDQIFSYVGNDVRLQSANFDAAAPYYDIEILSSASHVTISAG